MKNILLLSLIFVLTACGASPNQAIELTPIIATVLVPVSQPTEAVAPTAIPLPTQVPTLPPTEVPTLAPTLAPTEVPPTDVPPTAQVIVVTATSAPATATASGGPIPIDDVLGKGVFINMTMSNDVFTLRCAPREITFNITANNPSIVDAQFYYRVVDNPAGLYPSEWQNGGKMKGDGKGNFSLVFSGESVNPNLRLAKAWFDVQFIGLNKNGGAVDRTQKIERLVTYGIDCQ